MTEYCPHCKTDLSVEGKKKIGYYDLDKDRTTHWICPTCDGMWPREEWKSGFRTGPVVVSKKTG